MEVKYDKETEGVYIKLTDIKESFGIISYTEDITENVLLDFMKDGTLYGIQVLEAGKEMVRR